MRARARVRQVRRRVSRVRRVRRVRRVGVTVVFGGLRKGTTSKLPSRRRVRGRRALASHSPYSRIQPYTAASATASASSIQHQRTRHLARSALRPSPVWEAVPRSFPPPSPLHSARHSLAPRSPNLDTCRSRRSRWRRTAAASYPSNANELSSGSKTRLSVASKLASGLLQRMT